MKKIGFGVITILLLICTGCFNNNKDVLKTFKNTVEKLNSYKITGTLEIINNENTYTYDVEAAYKKNDMFKVDLKNKTNEHQQIILKNKEGVFVLTPSLNKSFKFQSDWPYNNSQSYLLQNILNDIENDEDKKIETKDDMTIVSTLANYSNNKKLTKQKIYFDNNANIKKVEVCNKDDIVKIRMTFNKVDINAKIKDEYFNLDKNMSTTKTTVAETTLETALYPMYIPDNTYLHDEQKVSKENGERIILTFAGDNPFMLIEETVNLNENDTIPVYGEIELLNDTIGYVSTGLASWISNGVEYYAVSETMSNSELLEVVNSISTLPVGK